MPSGIGITVYATSDTIGQRVFAGVNASRFTVEKGVKIIDEYAFYGCKGLQSITLPASLTVIEEEAFADGSFRSVFIPQGVKRIDDSAFTGINPLIIFGYSGTEAQRFADENGFAFVSVS